jgi:2-polyprenyl-3-methyl-5-hydroxy-6-metoxy-1,4-benzoquinol methylase
VDDKRHPEESARAWPCLICGASDHLPVFSEFGIVACQRCRHVFSTYVGDPHYDGFWGAEVPTGEQSYWNGARAGMFRAFLKRYVVGRSGRMLDMGCGLGYFVKAASAHPSWEVCGREISPTAVAYARDTLGLRQIQCGPLHAADWPDGSFDIITFWDVLDHLAKPDPVLARCRRLLKDDGICFIRTPNVRIQLPRARLKKLLRGMRRDLVYLQARDHLHHYSTASLCTLLLRNGFTRTHFIHLPPVDDEGRGTLTRASRSLLHGAVRAVASATHGAVNLDNLFAVAAS